MTEKAYDITSRVSALENQLRNILEILQARGGNQARGTLTGEVTPTDWQKLGDKLDQFEGTLSAKEKALLLTVFGAAAATYERAGLRESPAVSTRAPMSVTGALDRVKLSDGLVSIGSFQKGGAAGLAGSPVADSVNVGGDLECIHEDWVKDSGGNDAIVRGRWNALAKGNSRPGGEFGRSDRTRGSGFR
jgi:hypothetical protein